MENANLDISTLPKCFNKENCSCFDDIFIKPIYYNESDVLQYTSFNLREVIKYIRVIESHNKLDQQLNLNLHSHISASELSKATDHFLNTVRRFQNQLILHSDKGEFFCKHFNEQMSVNKLIEFYEELAHLNTKSLHLFNKPNSSMPTKYLLDILEMHRNCLYIFQQFYTTVQFGRPIYKKENPHINIHNFHFRPQY